MNLNGKQKRIIHEAILNAYTTHAQLSMMVTFELDDNLDRIGGNSAMDEVVFKLIQWAEARGKISNLITGALNDNPDNPKLMELQELVEQWNEPEPPPEPVAQQSTILDTETVRQPDVQEKPRQPFEPEMILIPAGPFLMGSDPTVDEFADDDEFPQHSLLLPDYYIAKTPVTNYQYSVFVQSAGYEAPEHWPDGKLPRNKANHPVVYIAWNDAVAYCDWLSKTTGRTYRLLTEAEWEKAARGSDGRIYPWGNEPPTDKLCNFNGGNIGDTTPVDKYPDGASPYGCLDMAGNIWEWCSSLYKPYPYDPDDGREDLQASGDRVLRGGSFDDVRNNVRCAYRSYDDPRLRSYDVGVRVVAPGAVEL